MSGAVGRATLRGHLEIMRFDHWVKNVFVLPGAVVAISVVGVGDPVRLAVRLVLGLLALGITASSNYVLNEVVDGPYDRYHEQKRHRPVPSGRANTRLAILQWLAFGALGLAIAATVSTKLVWTVAALWVMGIIYNVPPLRTKETAYLDVLTEALNNPIRMLAGWYIVGPGIIPPASLLMSYWMIGAYLMALKRLAEYRRFPEPAAAARYRRSFAMYTESSLHNSTIAYGSASMLFLGTFITRFRLELILSYPLLALIMALYFRLALVENSPVADPEHLYRQRTLMLVFIACMVVMSALMFIDIPVLQDIFAPTLPLQMAQPE